MAFSAPIVVAKSLPTIYLGLLRADKGTGGNNLLNACRSYGFFYLHLTSDPELFKLWDDMLTIMKHYFEQPLEVKMKDARGDDNYGYESMGTEGGPNTKAKDGYESLKVGFPTRISEGSADLTTTTMARSELDCFFLFIQQAHTITLTILSRLSSALGFSGSSGFERYHADPGPSLWTLGLLRYPKHDAATVSTNVGDNKRTDVGTLTFLLARQWGLQFLSLVTQRWEFIEARPGHAIINFGDSLRFPSGGELARVVHRVVPLRQMQTEDRYSIAYFLRPNDDVRFNGTTGKQWSAKEWHDFKFDVFKSPSTLDPGMCIVLCKCSTLLQSIRIVCF